MGVYHSHEHHHNHFGGLCLVPLGVGLAGLFTFYKFKTKPLQLEHDRQMEELELAKRQMEIEKEKKRRDDEDARRRLEMQHELARIDLENQRQNNQYKHERLMKRYKLQNPQLAMAEHYYEVCLKKIDAHKEVAKIQAQRWWPSQVQDLVQLNHELDQARKLMMRVTSAAHPRGDDDDGAASSSTSDASQDLEGLAVPAPANQAPEEPADDWEPIGNQ